MSKNEETVFNLGDKQHLETLYLARDNVSREHLLTIAMEELAELIQQVSKSIRGKEDKIHLAEEFADVLIALDFIRMNTKVSDADIHQWYEYKIKRLKDNLKTNSFK